MNICKVNHKEDGSWLVVCRICLTVVGGIPNKDHAQLIADHHEDLHTSITYARTAEKGFVRRAFRRFFGWLEEA